MKKSNENRRKRNVFGEFSSFFLQSLLHPSEDRPTVRCVSELEAQRIAVDAQKCLDDPYLRSSSASALVDELVAAGILGEIPLELGLKGKPLFAVGSQDPNSLSPIELLEAAMPSGTICYFSALEFYGLTTQIPTHHHVAKIVQGTRQPRRNAGGRPGVAKAESQGKRSRLGTLLFSYSGIPFYSTSRGSHTIAGIQLRRVSDKTIARITTLEQTLLDTLHRPLSCGGASVVWEAWDRALSEINQNRLAEHLDKIADPVMTRRTGYMLSANGFNPSELLGRLIEEAKPVEGARVSEEYSPLLPGYYGAQEDDEWQLVLP